MVSLELNYGELNHLTTGEGSKKKMVKSLPDAGLCFGSCLVVLVNSLLEVVKVLEAEGKNGKKKSKSRIMVSY